MLIVRLLRDLANRSPTWSCLSDWLIEILVDKCFYRNKFEDITLKFRHVFECISSGVFLLTKLNVSKQLHPCDENDVLIISDPCEERVDNSSQNGQQTDAITAATASQEGENVPTVQAASPAPVRVSLIDANLSEQQKEDLTSSAQHMLRLIAFNKIHEVLGMELVPKKIHNSAANGSKSDGSGIANSQGEEQQNESQEANENGENGDEDGENGQDQEAALNKDCLAQGNSNEKAAAVEMTAQC
jgi:zinc finger RNA-binding protein